MTQRVLSERMRRFVASAFGLGLIPRRLAGRDAGAGTFGAALAWGVSILMWDTAVGWQIAVAVAAGGLSLWSAAPFAATGEDPGWIAIDEVAGSLVALIGLTGWPWLVAAAVSRVGDITKLPPGVGAAEGWHGALGVTADDVVAGLYGLGAGWLVAALL